MKTVKRINRKPAGPTWTTKDGSVLRISEMEDRHILNSHRLLRRQPLLTNNIDQLLALESEMMKRHLMPLPVFLNAHDEAGYLLKARYLRMALQDDYDNAMESTGDVEF